jgi:hypothetical protein
MPEVALEGFSPEFFEDLPMALAQEQEVVVDEAIARLEGALKSSSDAELDRLTGEITSVTGCTEATALTMLQILATLATTLATEGLADDALADALLAAPANKLGAEEALRLRALLARLHQGAEATDRAFRARKAMRGVLPMFEALDGTVELRATQGVRQAGENEPSEPLELIPIASLRLALDSGTPRTLFFQVTEGDLENLQAQIGQLQSGLRELRERVQVRPR